MNSVSTVGLVVRRQAGEQKARTSVRFHLGFHFNQASGDEFREHGWPRGKALGWYAEGPRFDSASVLVSLQTLWSADIVFRDFVPHS